MIGIPLGVISAAYRDRWPDQLGRFFALTGVAMPSFWLGLMLLIVFYLWLGWFPGSGRIGSFFAAPPQITGLYLIDSLLAGDLRLFWNALQHITLPAVTQAAVTTGIITRITRSSMLEVLGQEYVKTARAKGLSERVVLYRHAFKNATLPVVTVTGMIYGYLLGGSVLVETIFSWPGIGRYAVHAISFLDFPGVMGVTMLVAAMFVVVNLLVDLSYFYLDPRIKLG